MTDPMTWVAAWLAGTSVYALGGWSYNLHWKRVWHKHADGALELAEEIAKDAGQWRDRAISAEADLARASARADHYASSWGRVMKLLRIAQKANKELRDAQMRREMADNIDRMAA